MEVSMDDGVKSIVTYEITLTNSPDEVTTTNSPDGSGGDSFNILDCTDSTYNTIMAPKN